MCKSVSEMPGCGDDALRLIEAARWPDEVVLECQALLDHTRSKVRDGTIDPCVGSDSIGALRIRSTSLPPEFRKIIDAILDFAERLARRDPPIRLRFDVLPCGRGETKRKVGLLIIFRPDRACQLAPEECRIYRYILVPIP